MKHPRTDARAINREDVAEATRLIVLEHNSLAGLPPTILADVLAGRNRRPRRPAGSPEWAQDGREQFSCG